MSRGKGVFGVVLACLFALAISAPSSDTQPQANPMSPVYPTPLCPPGFVGVFPDTNCRNYYFCVDGFLTKHICPFGELFDRVSKTCQPAVLVDCAAPPVVVVVPTSTTKPPPTSASTTRASSTTHKKPTT